MIGAEVIGITIETGIELDEEQDAHHESECLATDASKPQPTLSVNSGYKAAGLHAARLLVMSGTHFWSHQRNLEVSQSMHVSQRN